MNKHNLPQIAQVCTAKTWRGGEQQAIWLVEELQKIGIITPIICRKNSAVQQYCQQKQLPHVAFKRRWSTDPLFAYQLSSYCKHQNIQYLHIHDAAAHSLAIIAISLFNCPAHIILHRRVDFPVKNNPFSRFKYQHPKVAAIICVSKAVQQILIPSLRAPAPPITIIPDGVNLNRFNQKPTHNLKIQLQLHHNTILIGNVAAITQQKDYQTFVHVAALLLQQGFPAHFVIIGEGKQRPLIEQLIHQKQLQPHITLLGFRSDIDQLLPQLNYLLFTSETEGLGSTIIDAFAAKVPVVSTNAGGIPEIVKHLHNGWLGKVKQPQSLADGILYLHQHPHHKTQIIQHAQTDALAFSTQLMASQTAAFYQTLEA